MRSLLHVLAKPSFMVTNREFSKVIRVPFERAFSITNIKSGFEKCGIHPFNPNAIKSAKMLPAASYGSTNESGTSSEQSSTPSPAPFHGESSSVKHSTPMSSISAGSSSESNYPPSDSTTLTASVCNSEGSSLSSISSPSPVVSPLDSQSTSGVSCSTPTLNQLVRVHLIPPHLADILTPPAVTKEPTKRITGARDLTANEYFEWLKEEERKNKEAAEAKQSRAEERQRKKKEKEEESQRKKEEKEKKKQLIEERTKKQTSRKRLRDEPTASSACRKLLKMDQLVSKGDEQGPSTLDSVSSPKRRRQLPARFQESDSESDDGVLCTICSQKEPPGCPEIVFWIDCDRCDAWVHT